MADLRKAFGPPVATTTTQAGMSSVECDVLQQATDILQSELQTPGVQKVQDLLQHVIDSGHGSLDY